MKKALTSILKTCLRSMLVPEACRTHLHRLVGQFIPSNLQKLQVQGTGPPVTSRRVAVFQDREPWGTKPPPAAMQEHRGLAPGVHLCQCCVLQQHIANVLQLEEKLQSLAMSSQQDLVHAGWIYPAFALPAVRCC